MCIHTTKVPNKVSGNFVSLNNEHIKLTIRAVVSFDGDNIIIETSFNYVNNNPTSDQV
jgi:hypothetical protein